MQAGDAGEISRPQHVTGGRAELGRYSTAQICLVECLGWLLLRGLQMQFLIKVWA